MLNECYLASKDTTLQLIARININWGGESCSRVMNLSDLQFSPEKCELITHPSFQALLPYMWSGPLHIGDNDSKVKSYYYSRPWLVSIFYF